MKNVQHAPSGSFFQAFHGAALQLKVATIGFVFFFFTFKAFAQPCATAQNLNATQISQIAALLNPLDTALKYEDLYHIDSLSTELKNVYGTEGGRPDGIEIGDTLTTNTSWLNLSSAILLSRALINADTSIYSNLWKSAKGMAPPLYQPHSIFLRASAEIAAGLLKIAAKETDLTRKAIYQTWATRALDSLATMQLPNGAFPFPDLRTYGDATFSPIIQNFLNSCGVDSVNVLQGGFIVDDRGSGEFKFDAGVIANAYYEAFLYTGNINYKNISIAVGNYLKPLKFNHNYNYNTFASIGLTRAYLLTGDTTYLQRAIVNMRYSVLPGQTNNGRWVDGHNANSRYHSIIIQNTAPLIPLLPAGNVYTSALENMCYAAVKSSTDYTYTCHAVTGYRWLLKAYVLSPAIIPATLRDSITDLIGQHINQSAMDASFLDVPTMGEYLELLGISTNLSEVKLLQELNFTVAPNPSSGSTTLTILSEQTCNLQLSIYDSNGRVIKDSENLQIQPGTHQYQLTLQSLESGIYLLSLQTSSQSLYKKLVIINK